MSCMNKGSNKCNMSVNTEHNDFDNVKKPKHYNSHPSGVECIDIVQHMNYNTGNAIKYLWRKGIKNPTKEGIIEDLEKAKMYIEKEIERVKKFE